MPNEKKERINIMLKPTVKAGIKKRAGGNLSAGIELIYLELIETKRRLAIRNNDPE